MGQICPVLSTRIMMLSPGLENNDSMKCSFDSFATQPTYVVLLEIFQNNNSMYRRSTIQGTSWG